MSHAEIPCRSLNQFAPSIFVHETLISWPPATSKHPALTISLAPVAIHSLRIWRATANTTARPSAARCPRLDAWTRLWTTPVPMCRYRSYYYAACCHHELVLFDFCDRARRAQAATTTAEDVRSDGDNGLAATCSREGASPDVNTDDLPSIFSAHSTHESQSSDPSIEHGSASITAEPDHDWTSLLPPDLSYSSSATSTLPYDMAGLPLFGHTFRSWMGSSTATSPKQTNVDSQGHVYLSNRRSVEAVSSSHSGISSIVLTISPLSCTILEQGLTPIIPSAASLESGSVQMRVRTCPEGRASFVSPTHHADSRQQQRHHATHCRVLS